jgi:hypothetical protein
MGLNSHRQKMHVLERLIRDRRGTRHTHKKKPTVSGGLNSLQSDLEQQLRSQLQRPWITRGGDHPKRRGVRAG